MNRQSSSIKHKSSIQSSDLNSVFKKFSELKVLIVGDVMLDAYVWGSAERISPEAPVPVVDVEKVEERLGGAANVAMNINALDAKPILCSLIGQDYGGEKIMSILKNNGMSTEGMIQMPGRITGIKTRVLSKNHHLIRFDMETTSDLEPAEEQKLLKTIKTIVAKEKPAAVIFEDYNKGVLTETLITSLLKFCREKKILTAVDPKKKNFFAYRNADLFKPNLREVHEALNTDVNSNSESSLNAVHKELKKKLQHGISLITLGNHGIFYSNGKLTGIIPAHQRDVSDVSGAGDTVIAVATLALAAGMKLNEAAGLANLAGGLVCEHAGVIPITKEMLIEESKSPKSRTNNQ